MPLENSQFENLRSALPTKKDEAWKFTSLSEFKKIDWSKANAAGESLTHDQLQELSRHLPSEFYNLVFVNGVLNSTLSDDLNDQIQSRAFEKSAIEQSHPEKNLIEMARLFSQNELVVTIRENSTFEKPLHLLFVRSGSQPTFINDVVRVKVSRNAELTLITQTVSLAEDSVLAGNISLQIEAFENSRLKVIELQNENLNSYHFSQTSLRLYSDSTVQALTLTLGGKLCRNYLHLEFLGHGADAGVYGLSALNKDQHADNYTYIQHTKGANNSRQLYKSILADSSHSVFRGRVRIEKDAQKANSEQLNNNLLLTREAQADSIPQLEIFADDVKAGHGATMGQLDQEEIFYFLSRGIGQNQAIKMLSVGYAQEVIYFFENTDVRNWLAKKLNQKLDGIIHV